MRNADNQRKIERRCARRWLLIHCHTDDRPLNSTDGDNQKESDRAAGVLTNVCPVKGWDGCSHLSRISRIDRDLKRSNVRANQVKLSVHPAVAAYLLKEGEQMKNRLERAHKYQLLIEQDEELDQDEYNIVPDGKVKKREQPCD